MVYFDSNEIKDIFLQNGKVNTLPLFFFTNVSKKLVKKINNDEILDVVYIVDHSLKQHIPLLKYFDFSYSKYNSIQLFHYSYYRVGDNGDEFLIEVKIEKNVTNNLWSIEADFNIFINPLVSNELTKTISGHIKSEDKIKVDFLKDIKRLKLNIQAFFIKYNIKH